MESKGFESIENKWGSTSWMDIVFESNAGPLMQRYLETPDTNFIDVKERV